MGAGPCGGRGLHIRLFGIRPFTAVKYVNAAHPDKSTAQNPVTGLSAGS